MAVSHSHGAGPSRYAWVAFLYFAQGLPAGIINKTLPVVFSAQGVDLAQIGLLSVAGLPWTFKFLWAPVVDGFGSRRHWVAGCLFGIAALFAVFSTQFAGHVTAVVWMLLVAVVFLSATQDIAIDAGTIELFSERELGTANGIRVMAYRVALILAGGLLVSLAAGFKGGFPGLGWPATWRVTALVFAALGVVACFMPSLPRASRTAGLALARKTAVRIALPLAASGFAWWLIGRAVEESSAALPTLGRFLARYQTPLAVLAGLMLSLTSALRSRPALGEDDSLRRFMDRPGAWVIAFFILTFKIGDSAMSPMTTPFLNRQALLSEAEIGLLLNTFGVGGTILGAMLGGVLTSRWGIFRALWMLGLFQAFSNLGYVYAASHISTPVVWSVALCESFCGGLGTAPFLAFMMAICDKREAATGFAFLSAIYVLSGAIAGGFSGYLAEPLGFGPYFLLTFLLALPAFAGLGVVKRWLS